MATMPFAHNMPMLDYNGTMTIGPTQTRLPIGQQATLLNRTRQSNDVELSSSASPHYFVLENKEQQHEPVYDAVYQNITDGNND